MVGRARRNGRSRARTRSRRALFAGALVLAAFSSPKAALAQACCVGASGLTPGWLTNHERALVGAQVRFATAHGTYPASGSFYDVQPGRDARVEPTLFGSLRLLPRAQVSVSLPFVVTRRRSGAVTESREALGDITLVARYDLFRAGERRWPGVALLAGALVPTGTPTERGDGLLAANVTGIGSWEGNAGVSLEETYGHVVLHVTVLAGLRTARDVFGVSQRPGVRSLYLVGAGWVWDDDTSMLLTATHSSDGAATLDGATAEGTGFRTTQLAFVVTTPITDTLRLRTSIFTDVPPLGTNRQALGGTTIGLAKTWF